MKHGIAGTVVILRPRDCSGVKTTEGSGRTFSSIPKKFLPGLPVNREMHHSLFGKDMFRGFCRINNDNFGGGKQPELHAKV